VLDEVFAVLEPAALAATAHTQRLHAFELAVERARYEADRARRQFEALEPENRLVARTLEAAWESALSEMRRAEGSSPLPEPGVPPSSASGGRGGHRGGSQTLMGLMV
jgi:hypothetical protein